MSNKQLLGYGILQYENTKLKAEKEDAIKLLAVYHIKIKDLEADKLVLQKHFDEAIDRLAFTQRCLEDKDKNISDLTTKYANIAVYCTELIVAKHEADNKADRFEEANTKLQTELDELGKHYTEVVSKNLDQCRQLERQAAYIQQLQHYISYLTPYTNHATEH